MVEQLIGKQLYILFEIKLIKIFILYLFARQIRESVSYLFEESMLHYYFSAILKSFWPGGVLASAYPVRSEDMKEMTTNAAKALLMDNIPEVLCNLVGAQAAKRGILKVFDALQNPIYNKQLFYVSHFLIYICICGLELKGSMSILFF